MAVRIKSDLAKRSDALPESKVYFIQKVIKGDTYMVLADSQLELEDEFLGLYYTSAQDTKILLQPPYNPQDLLSLVTRNNVLLQCIEAMVVNIDGTGYEFESITPDEDIDEKELAKATAFFEEPYPNM